MKNKMELCFLASAENESFARMVISSFLMPIDPRLSDIAEIRTAVSEAVTNAVVHAYKGDMVNGEIVMRAMLNEDRVEVEIEDYGCGIEDLQQAMTPFYTSQPDQERSGMGFSLMQSFMDGVSVKTAPGKGTCVRMMKLLI